MAHPAPRHRPHPGPPVETDPYDEAALEVWIDQDLCTGDGICVDICPEVFVILEDGIAYVREADAIMNDPGGHTGVARVPSDHEEAVISAASDCPGECIFVGPREGRAAA